MKFNILVKMTIISSFSDNVQNSQLLLIQLLSIVHLRVYVHVKQTWYMQKLKYIVKIVDAD